MNGKDALLTGLRMARNMTKMFIGDLSDADLLVRPVPGANHIAWQIGHFLALEDQFVRETGRPSALPPEFGSKHSKSAASSDAPADFYTKAEYIAFLDRVSESTAAYVNSLNDADLDQPTVGPLAAFAPTRGAMLVLLANHEMMHTGQFTVIRRKLGKPVLF